MLRGLDDITETNEIIIVFTRTFLCDLTDSSLPVPFLIYLFRIQVEGEIDKLSIEEAGYYNRVSVPGGAPQTVSIQELPSMDKVQSAVLHNLILIRAN